MNIDEHNDRAIKAKRLGHSVKGPEDATPKVEHTPTPWTQFIVGKQYHVGICQAKSAKEIALVLNQKDYAEADANADFIVCAVNSYEALLDSAKNALLYLQANSKCKGESDQWLIEKQLQSAIAQAEGK